MFCTLKDVPARIRLDRRRPQNLVSNQFLTLHFNPEQNHRLPFSATLLLSSPSASLSTAVEFDVVSSLDTTDVILGTIWQACHLSSVVELGIPVPHDYQTERNLSGPVISSGV
jgi:hypothetical protein